MHFQNENYHFDSLNLQRKLEQSDASANESGRQRGEEEANWE